MIQQYLDGSLDPTMMHELEAESLDDPFLWEALEGYTDHSDAAVGISILQRQLQERIGIRQENKRLFDITWQRLSIAAASAVLFILAGILFWMNGQKRTEQLASNQNPIEVNAIHPDSVGSVLSKEGAIIAEHKSNASADQPRLSASKEGNPDNSIASTGILSAKDLDSSVEGVQTNGNSLRPSLSRSDARSSAALVAQQLVRPANGWVLFHQYLKNEASKFKTGTSRSETILLTITVDADGELREVRTVKGYNEVLDREAVRIVREGPKWLGADDGKAHEALVEVVFEP